MNLDDMEVTRVLHLGKFFPPHYGGIETFMSQLMQIQAEKGIVVSAIVHQTFKDWSANYKLWNGCKVVLVKSYGQLVYAPVAPYFPFSLLQAINAEKPNVLHVHMPNLSAFWLLLVPLFSKLNPPIVIHWHSDVIGAVPDLKVKLMYPIYRIFERLLLKKASKIICTSPNYMKSSLALKKYIDKCQVIPLGLAQNEANLSTCKKQPSDMLKLSMVGRLTYYKGHELLIRALYALKIHNIYVSLDIVGDGELFGKIRNLCVELDLESQITFHGKVNNKEKFSIIKNSDLLCLPSIERTEAFGLVLLEAAANGIPAIVSNVAGSGMTFVVKDGLTGLVFENNSLESLISKLQWATQQNTRLKSMGKAAMERYETEFSMNKIYNTVKEMYHEL